MKALLLFVLFYLSIINGFSQAPTISAFTANTSILPGFSGATGTTMIINGTNFTGATAVSFGGTPASSFLVVSSIRINAVVAGGSTGFVTVTTPAGTVTSSGANGVFTYLPLSTIVTDFGGYWSSTTSNPTGVTPDSSHNLIGFGYNNSFYSTGAKDSILTARGISFTPGLYRAFPVSGITGTNTGSGSVYLAVAGKADGSPLTANVSGVSTATIRSVLIDGIRGLDLGTGVTNLPKSAVMTFNLSNIDITKISDAEPDIILTQIAQATSANDTLKFIDASGVTVGNSLTQDMTVLPSFGNYKPDLFVLAFAPYDNANPTGVNATNDPKPIRVVGLKLSDFGITPANAGSIRAMKITPSGTSDYAFIAYNTKIISAAPNISQNDATTVSSVCTVSNPATLAVIGTASVGGALSYTWQRSTDGGNVFTTITNGGNFSGTTTATLTVTNPVNNDKYQALVSEGSGGTTNTSSAFTLVVSPITVGGTIAGSAAVCIGSNSTLLTLSGYTGSVVKWQFSTDNFSSVVTDVSNTTATLTATNLTATRQYRAVVQSGACTSANSAIATVTVNASIGGSVAGSTSVCTGTNSTSLTLSGHTGSILRWESSLNSFSTVTTIANITTSLTASNLSATTEYRAVLKNGTCATANSSAGTVTVNPVSVGGTAAGNSTVCAGTNSTTITLSGHTGSVVNWESSTNNFSTVSTIANTTNTLTATDLTATTLYRAVVQSGNCSSANSASASVTVSPATVGGSIAGSSTVCTGTNSTTLTLSGNTGSVVKWQSSTNNFTSATDIINTTTTLTATNLSVTTQYRAVVQSGSCATTNSAIVTITVVPNATWMGGANGDWNNAANWCGGIPTSPVNVSIPAGSAVTITTVNAFANNVNIEAGGSLILNGTGNLIISNGATFTNNGTYNAVASTTGKVSFAGSGSISGATTFKNIETYGALNFGTASTISGEFTLQTGGSLVGNSPTYTCPGSALVYRATGIFVRGLEWTSAATGAGYPSNVYVQNNTTLNFPVVGPGYVCNDLIIDGGSALNQNYSGGSAPLTVSRDVTINGDLSLGALAGGDINLGRNWTRNTGGVFTHNNRTVNFIGSSASVISAPILTLSRDANGAFGGETFYKMNINKTSEANALTLASHISVIKEFKLLKGSFDLVNSDVTIVSKDEVTASVSSIPTSNGAISGVNINYSGTGKFVIQRHLSMASNSISRRWRMLTTPLQSGGAPTINQAWQQGVSTSDRNAPIDPWPGFGTTITKSPVYNVADGYDQGITANPSMYYPTNAAGNITWGILPSTHTPITNYEGYMLFARGNRNIVISTQFINANSTILEPKGRINTGDVQKNIRSGSQLIGNPYASAINFGTVTYANYVSGGTTFNTTPASATGAGITYYLWDPKTSGNFNVGKWITCSSNGDGTFAVTGNTSGLLTNGIIESSAAFMINSDVESGSLTFHETDKNVTSSSVGVASRETGTGESIVSLATNLLVGTSSNASIADGVINSYHTAFRNQVDGQDATGLSNFNTSDVLTIKSQGKYLAVERRNDIADSDTIFLSLQNVSRKGYVLQFKATNMKPTVNAILQDSYTGISSPISMTDTTLVAFEINDDAKSGASDRFKIVFKSTGVLPITFSHIKATAQNDNIAIQWKVENEMNIVKYEVERSYNGREFNKINTTQAIANSQPSAVYNWFDVNYQEGDNYYRVKSTSQNGETAYTKIVKVVMGKNRSSVIVFPNPVHNQTIGLQFINMTPGSYSVIISNNIGQVLDRQKIQYPGGSSMMQFKPTRHISSGRYTLEIVHSSGGYRQSLTILVQENK